MKRPSRTSIVTSGRQAASSQTGRAAGAAIVLSGLVLTLSTALSTTLLTQARADGREAVPVPTASATLNAHTQIGSGQGGQTGAIQQVRRAGLPPVPADPRAIVADVSCAGETFCVVVGNAWTENGAPEPIARVSDGHGGWTQEQLPSLADGTTTYRIWRVSCPDVTFCTATGTTSANNENEGGAGKFVALTRTPAGWQVMQTPVQSPDSNFACAGPDQCVASRDNLWTWDGSTWSKVVLDFPGWRPRWYVTETGCSGDGYCLSLASGIDDHGRHRSWTLSWDGQQWLPVAPTGGGGLYGMVECASSTLCAFSDYDPMFDYLSTQGPLKWNGEYWGPFEVSPESSLPADVSCATTCTVLWDNPNNPSQVAILTAGANGAPDTLQHVLAPMPDRRAHVAGHACAADYCVILDRRGVLDADEIPGMRDVRRSSAIHIVTGDQVVTEPWSRPGGRPIGRVAALECPTANYCVAGVQKGDPQLLTEWKGQAWKPFPAPFKFLPDWNSFTSHRGLSISCVSADWCAYGYDANTKNGGVKGGFAVRHNGQWHRYRPVQAEGLEITKLTCSSRSSCVLVGFNYGRHVMQTWDGHRWHNLNPPRAYKGGYQVFKAVSCPSSTMCVAVGYSDFAFDAHEFTAVWRNRSWKTSKQNLDLTFNSVECLSASRCLAYVTLRDFPDQRELGWIYELHGMKWVKATSVARRAQGLDCVAGGPCVATSRTGVVSWTGSRWSRVAAVPPELGSRSVTTVSCPTARTCFAAGRADGSVTDQFLTFRP